MADNDRIEQLLIELANKVTQEHDVLKRLDAHEKECIDTNKEVAKQLEKLVTKVEVMAANLKNYAQDNEVAGIDTRLAVVESRQTLIFRMIAGAGMALGVLLIETFMQLLKVM